MRLSSLRCYRQIKEEGLLSRRRMEAFDCLVEFGPCTAGELHRDMGKTMARNDLASRLRELKELGVAQEMPQMRDCSVTGRMCLVWDVVDQLPSKDFPERITSRQKIRELEAQNEVLMLQNQALLSQLESAKKKGQLPLL